MTYEETRLERVKAAIAEKFAPAIDMRAPYAKLMVEAAAQAAIDATLASVSVTLVCNPAQAADTPPVDTKPSSA